MPAMALKDEFDAAVSQVNNLPEMPAQDTQLELYSLFKQATRGDVEGKRPGMLNVVARAKYDAWAGRKGMSRDEAMQAYIDLSDRLAGR